MLFCRGPGLLHVSPAIVLLFSAPALSLAQRPRSSLLPDCHFETQPGLEYLGAGVDLASFLPSSSAVSNLKQYAVDLSCGDKNEWRNPYSNKTFAIWDQISSILPDPSSTRDGAFFRFDDTFQFTEHFSESVSSGGLFGLFSASERLDQVFELAVKANVSLFYDYGKVNAFVAMLDYAKLKPSQQYLDAVSEFPLFWWLPQNWASVAQHMKVFGTHYVWEVSLGGEFRYESACESFYISTSGSVHAEAQAAADFLFLLKMDGGASGDASAAETAYQLMPECWNAQNLKKRRGNKPNFFEFSEVGC